MHLRTVLFLAFICQSAVGSDELERFLDEDVNTDLQILEQLYDSTYEHRRAQAVPVPKNAPFRDSSTETSPFQAVLQAGSKLQRLVDNNYFQTKKPLYVRARLHQEGSPYSYLLNKQEKSVYLTRTTNLSSLKEVTSLYPSTDPTERQTVQTPFQSVDKNLAIDTKLSVSFESLNADYLASFHNLEQGKSSSQRFQMESFIDGKSTVDFGLGLSFQDGQIGEATDLNRVSYRAIYFGPVIKKQLYQKEKSAFDFFLKAQMSLSLESQDELHQNSFSSNIYSLGADWTYHTLIGKIFVGLNYQQQRISLKSTTNLNLLIPAQKEAITGFGVHAGYRFMVNL